MTGRADGPHRPIDNLGIKPHNRPTETVGPTEFGFLRVGRSEEAMKRGGDKCAFLEPVKNGRHGIGGLGVEIVQQDDGPWLARGENVLGYGGTTRLFPVFGID